MKTPMIKRRIAGSLPARCALVAALGCFAIMVAASAAKARADVIYDAVPYLVTIASPYSSEYTITGNTVTIASAVPAGTSVSILYGFEALVEDSGNLINNYSSTINPTTGLPTGVSYSTAFGNSGNGYLPGMTHANGDPYVPIGIQSFGVSFNQTQGATACRAL